MAQASANFSARPAFRLQLDVNQTAQSVDGNYSIVNITLHIFRNSASATWSNNASYWSVDANGQHWEGSFTYDFRNSDGLLLFAVDIRVDHNADGTKAIGASGSSNASVLGSANPSLGLTLNTIPRATQPSLRYTLINAGDTQVVNLPRASAGFTHNIELRYGNTVTLVAQGATDSASFVVPLDMLRQTPNNTVGNGLVRAITLSGSTQIGYKDTPINIQAGPTIIPTFSAITAAEATPGVAANVGALVKSISTLVAEITGAAGVYGSTIASYQIRFSNGQPTINAAKGTTTPLQSSGNLTITGRVTDSRGRYTEKSITVTVLNYAPPAINTATLARALSSGVIDENGTRAKLNLNASVSSLVVGGTQKNAIIIRVSQRLRGDTTWTVQTPGQPGGVSYSANTLLVPTFGIEQAYEVRVEIIDDFMTSMVILTLATANIFMHWDAKVGVGIGKFRENGMLDVLGDIYHRDGGQVQPPGIIVPYAGSSSPKGWLICNGSLVSRSTYAGLFAIIGETYGAGDGSTTFAVPNLKGRAPFGVDSTQTEFDTIGETGGAKAVALTIAGQNAPHSHGVRRTVNEASNQGTATGGSFADRVLITGTPVGGDVRTGPDGGGVTHENMSPYMALHYLIKV